MTTTGTLSTLAKHFTNEDAAIAKLESIRWPNGAACPHCGGADPHRVKVGKAQQGKRGARKGLWRCTQCQRQFTVKVGTVFEQSHIPVSKWLLAIHLLAASKEGMSAHQLHRMLGMTYRAAWFMVHRLRHAMAAEGGRFNRWKAPWKSTTFTSDRAVAGWAILSSSRRCRSWALWSVAD